MEEAFSTIPLWHILAQFLNVLDKTLTFIALYFLNGFRERNVFLNLLIQKFGIHVSIFLGLVVTAFMLYLISRGNDKLGKITLIILSCSLLVVSVSNAYLLYGVL